MRDAASNPHFVAKALQRAFVAHRLGQKLERHLLAEGQIVGAIDLAHSAASEKSNQAVASGNQPAGNKASFFALRGRTG